MNIPKEIEGLRICTEIRNNKKIGAIKILRNLAHDHTGTVYGLVESKDAVEAYWDLARNNSVRDWEFMMVLFTNSGKSVDEAAGMIVNPRMNVPETEMVMGKIIGWRAFVYTDKKLRPISLRNYEFTTFGKNVDTAPEPDVDNKYGFWCFKNKTAIQKYADPPDCNSYSFVFATVLLTGTVIEHDLGYRASEMEIIGMYGRMNNSRRRGIAHNLGWPGRILPLAEGQEEFPVEITTIPSQEG